MSTGDAGGKVFIRSKSIWSICYFDLYRSKATEFSVNPDNNHEIIPPFKVLDGLGDNVAEGIIKARNEKAFTSVEDFKERAPISDKHYKKLDSLHVFKDMKESDQVSLFDFSY